MIAKCQLLGLLMLCLALTVACAPATPPEPTPVTEVRITTADALVGTWQEDYRGGVLTHKFQSNGMVVVKWSEIDYAVSSGRYWFEDDLLTFNDPGGDCAGMAGRYEVYAIYDGEQPIQLRFVLNGEDACITRVDALDGKIMLPSKK